VEKKIVTTTEEFELLKDDWERIEKLSPITTYHSTFNFNMLWWKTYKNVGQKQLFIIVVYNNNKVIGIAPLKIEKSQSRIYSYFELKFLATADYSDFLIDNESGIDSMKIITEIFSAIDKNKRKFDKIWLTHIAQHTLLAHFLFISNYNRYFHYLIENPYIDFSKFQTFEDYTKAFFPKKTKQYLNRLKREINFEMIVSSDNIIDKISKLHIAEKNYLHTKGKTHRHSFFENTNSYSFFKKLYTANLNVLTYLLFDKNKNDELICFYSGYVYNNIFHSGITAYNPNYQHLSVGKIFNYLIFETNMKEQRWMIFDMGTGRYAWKFEMTDTFNLLYQLCVFQPSNKKVYFMDKFEKLILSILQFLRK
jgi:CelD/BcsL family acetyltransferase involved in cellulose biosynthesis